MPPNTLDGNDLGRGRRFDKICQELFDGVANVEIGRILAGYEKENDSAKGYSEGSIRRWKAGGPIGATALLNIQRLGVNLEYLLEGKQNAPPASAGGEIGSENSELLVSSLRIQELLSRLGLHLADRKSANDFQAIEPLLGSVRKLQALLEAVQQSRKNRDRTA